MIQEAPLDVDKFLAGNGNSSNQMPFNNLRGGMPNQENQYFLSNIGPGPNSSNYSFFFYLKSSRQLLSILNK